MQTLSRLLLCVALASATANAASAYSFSPPHILAKLKGTLTFTPNEGGQPFTCQVTMYLKTKSGEAIPEIRTVRLSGADCAAVAFLGLPWGVSIADAKSGQIGFRGFDSSAGDCAGEALFYQDDRRGVWTLPAGGCLSGTLRSHPPVTIVK